MDGRSKYFLLFSDIVIFGIANILVKCILVFLMPIYTLYLTSEEYGIAELFNNFLDIIYPIMTLCIADAVYRFSIDGDCVKVFSSSIPIVLNSIVLMTLICIIYFGVTKNILALYFLCLFVAYTFYKLNTQFARGMGHVKRFAVTNIINALIMVGISVFLLKYLNGGIKSFLLSYIFAYTISGLFSFCASREFNYLNWKEQDKKLVGKMLRFSVPNVPNMLSWWINNVSDRYLLIWLSGANTVGVYAAAGKIPAVINMWSMIFQQAWQYWASKEIGRENNTNFYTTVFNYFASFMFSICSLMIVLTPLVIPFLLKNEFLDGMVFIPFLLVAATLSCFSGFFVSLYIAKKNNYRAMISTLCGACANLGLNLLLIPQFGGLGAAFATLISYLVITTICIIDTKKIIKLEINWFKFFSLFIIVSFEAFVVILEGKYNKLFMYGCVIITLFVSFKDVKKILFRKR